MEKKQTSSLVAGLVISLILVVLSLVIYFTKLYTKTWIQYIGSVILFAGVLYAVLNHSKEKKHFTTFGNLFAYGFKTTAVVICITIAYTLLSGFLMPDAKREIIELSRQQALSQPGANESQVEQGMAMFEKNYTLFIVVGILFSYLVIGAVASLIGAAVSKKEKIPEFENV